MHISSINSILGWFYGDKLKFETKTIYHYDKGNDITVVERRLVDVHLYNNHGQVVNATTKGHSIDLKV